MTRKERIWFDRLALANAFPACFNPPGSGLPKHALKIGIHRDLFQCRIIGHDGAPLSRSRIRDAVIDYCKGAKYFRARQPGKPRINLEGDSVGTVEEFVDKRRAAFEAACPTGASLGCDVVGPNPVGYCGKVGNPS